MKEYIENHPINSTTEPALVKWVCDYHNYINKLNGKKEQDCEKVPVLWGRDDCDCDEVVSLADKDDDDKDSIKDKIKKVKKVKTEKPKKNKPFLHESDET